MWSRFVLKRAMAKRTFSTFSKVQANSILLNSVSPTTIRIPVGNGQSYDYIINRDHTVAQFEGDISDSCGSDINQVSIDAEKEMKVEDLIQSRFQIQINSKEYTVHPDLSSMLELKNRKLVDNLTVNHSFPVVRGAILEMFLDNLVTALPKDPISKQQLKKILEKAVKDYRPERQGEMLVNIKAELKKTEEELAKWQDLRENNGLEQKAQTYASKMLFFGLSMAAGQVGGFAYLIYGLYTWDDIEPVTYLVGAFYAWVSIIFYFRYREDWEWSSAHTAFYERKLRNLYKQVGYDESRIEFLNRYHELLKLQLAYIEK